MGLQLPEPRLRVVSDNDYGGDPDGLVQLAHLLLSPSVDTRAVIASREWLPQVAAEGAAAVEDACAQALLVADLCGRSGVPVVAGAETGLRARHQPAGSRAAQVIVHEAMREDVDLPLVVICGGGLTAVADAWLQDPRIAQRLTVVWIGGAEHPSLADPPPDAPPMEYNTGIDVTAAQVVFDDSDLTVWQVPRDAYRTAMVSRAELAVRMAGAGALGGHLYDRLTAFHASVATHGLNAGEVYVLGDSPLITLSALLTAFDPGPASSPWVTLPCPRLLATGEYAPRPDGRPLRVFTHIDSRLTFEDLYSKLSLRAAAAAS